MKTIKFFDRGEFPLVEEITEDMPENAVWQCSVLSNPIAPDYGVDGNENPDWNYDDDPEGWPRWSALYKGIPVSGGAHHWGSEGCVRYISAKGVKITSIDSGGRYWIAADILKIRRLLGVV